MAIYHLSVKAISRSAGRSATAAAAYRAGVEITDTRTGEVHDYTRKGGVMSADIVLPNGAPEWANNRGNLWNAAEHAERRKDSCVAREFEVALPSELSPEARRKLALDFAHEMADREGCAVDVAIHAPSKGGDNRNHHAHILRTTRKVGEDGLTDKLDSEKAGRNRAADLEAMRARWAELTNERLRDHGIEARVDHRSLKEQGIDREPTVHLGPTVTAMERRGISTAVRERIAEEVQTRLLAAREQGEKERAAAQVQRPGLIDLSVDVTAARASVRADAEKPQSTDDLWAKLEAKKAPDRATEPKVHDWSQFKKIAGSVKQEKEQPKPAHDWSQFKKIAGSADKTEVGKAALEPEKSQSQKGKEMNERTGPLYFPETKQEREEREREAPPLLRLEKEYEEKAEQEKATQKEAHKDVAARSKTDELWEQMLRQRQEREEQEKARERDSGPDLDF